MGSPASFKHKVLALLRPAPPAAPTSNVQSAQRATLRTRLLGGAVHGLMSALAAVIAYVPTHALGLHQGFWGAITAIGVVQTEFHASESTARNQFTGAAIGGLIGFLVLLALGGPLWAYVAAVGLSVLACWAMNVAGASQLAGITATIIMLVPRTGSPGLALASRVGEVGWGVTVGITVVWLAARLKALRA